MSFSLSDLLIVQTGCLMVFIQLSFLIVYILGVFHAFCQSAVLGIASIIFPHVTIVIEFVDWFSTKRLWWEIAQILGL